MANGTTARLIAQAPAMERLVHALRDEAFIQWVMNCIEKENHAH